LRRIYKLKEVIRQTAVTAKCRKRQRQR